MEIEASLDRVAQHAVCFIEVPAISKTTILYKTVLARDEDYTTIQWRVLYTETKPREPYAYTSLLPKWHEYASIRRDPRLAK